MQSVSKGRHSVQERGDPARPAEFRSAATPQRPAELCQVEPVAALTALVRGRDGEQVSKLQTPPKRPVPQRPRRGTHGSAEASWKERGSRSPNSKPNPSSLRSWGRGWGWGSGGGAKGEERRGALHGGAYRESYKATEAPLKRVGTGGVEVADPRAIPIRRLGTAGTG